MSVSTVLKICIFFTGFAGIVAEYSLATLATYLLGNAVLQWSVVISIFLLSMGLGSHVSRYIPDGKAPQAFILAELLLSLLVPFSVPIAYHFAGNFLHLQTVIYGLSFTVGTLIGLEIPLAVRINNLYEELKVNISSVLEKDYLGSVPAGLLYAYFLLPKFGLALTSLLAGFFNFLSALLLIRILRIKSFFKFLALFTFLLIAVYAFSHKRIILYEEQKFYGEEIIHFEQTPYQKVVLTRYGENYSLYLDGHLQFSTIDEVRYHETLVHVPASFLKNYEKALILGGGDGLALRELRKYPFKEIHLVDIDPYIISLSRKNPIMRRINENSFYDSRLKVFTEDAFKFVRETKEKYDIIVIDLIDPRTPSSARVYSLEFYKILKRRLKEDGLFITQAGDAFYKKEVFCSIIKTIKEAVYYTYPLILYIPTFGEWGMVIGSKKPLKFENLKIKARTRFLNEERAYSFYTLGKVLKCPKVEVNTLLKPILIHYYYKFNSFKLN
ncbi:MAG: polyamine aminopropyltransferase [Aquifex sp.]|nr:MAG: polyamine aminopropyltransferase [Aquifex sp.]